MSVQIALGYVAPTLYEVDTVQLVKLEEDFTYSLCHILADMLALEQSNAEIARGINERLRQLNNN